MAKRQSRAKVTMTTTNATPSRASGRIEKTKDYIKAYLDYKDRTRPLTDSTIREYRRYLGAYIDALGGMDRVDGDNDRMRTVLLDWLSSPMDGGVHGAKEILTAGTINRRRAYVSAWLRWLDDEQIIPGLDTGQILRRIPRRRETRKNLRLTQDDVDSIGRYFLEKYKKSELVIDLRNYLIYQTLMTTGMRATECGSFPRRDLHISSVTGAHLRLQADITKGQRERYIPIADIDPALWLRHSARGAGKKAELHKLWESYYQWHSATWAEDVPLFATIDGNCCKSSVIYQQIKPAMKLLGINATVHDLRHWALTQLAAVSKDTLLVKTIAGHASITTTMLYMHPDRNTICSAAGETIKKIRNKAS